MENLFLLLRTKDFHAFLKAELKEWLGDHAFGRKESETGPLIFCRTIPVRARLLSNKLRISASAGGHWMICGDYWRSKNISTVFKNGFMNRSDFLAIQIANTATPRLAGEFPSKSVAIAYGYVDPMWQDYDGLSFAWTWVRWDSEVWIDGKFCPSTGEKKIWVARELVVDRDPFPNYMWLGKIIPEPTSVPLFAERYLLSIS